MLVPLISHSPVVFWLLPAFGLRGAGYFLATTEMIFGSAHAAIGNDNPNAKASAAPAVQLRIVRFS